MNVIFPSIFSFLLVAMITPFFIRFLRAFNLVQPIRKELPENHQAKKGTPLMAGVVLLIGAIISLVYKPNPMMLFLTITFVFFSAVGMVDDIKKAVLQDPGGISGKTKLFLQFTITGGLLFILLTYFGLDSNIHFFKLDLKINIAVYFLLALLFIVGSANAINFTDGLDGLLIVAALPTYCFFFLVSEHVEVKAFSLIMIGSLLGLLIYNAYPAKAFMGDTGSLAIGGSLSFLAVIEKVEVLIPILFIIYFAEQLSVILQVWYYKKTKLRLFKMSPIHYHYSLKYGWSEKKIVIIFGLVSWVAVGICYSLHLLYW